MRRKFYEKYLEPVINACDKSKCVFLNKGELKKIIKCEACTNAMIMKPYKRNKV